MRLPGRLLPERRDLCLLYRRSRLHCMFKRPHLHYLQQCIPFRDIWERLRLRQRLLQQFWHVRVLLGNAELPAVYFRDCLHQLQQSVCPVRWLLCVQYRLLRLDCHNVHCLHRQYGWLHVVQYCQQLFGLRHHGQLRPIGSSLRLQAGLLPARNYLRCLHGRMRDLFNFSGLHNLQCRCSLC